MFQEVSSLRGLLGLGSMLGIVPPNVQLLVNGLERAPAPKQTQLGGDWLANLDVMMHGMGCMVCGLFDELVTGKTRDQIAELRPEQLDPLLPDIPMVAMAAKSSFEVCKELYLKYGDLTDAADAGKFDPGGIMMKGAVMPAVKQGIELQKQQKQQNMDSLLGDGGVQGSSQDQAIEIL